jgi:hypothetical protein
MTPEELSEQAEHAHHSGQKAIGLTTAITAVLLAVATLLGHRAHTEEIKLQTKAVDEWNFYQAKHQRAHDYSRDAEKEEAAGHHELALRFVQDSLDEECGTPAEKNCTVPRLKKSQVLQRLMADQDKSETSPLGSEPASRKIDPEKGSSEHQKAQTEPAGGGEGARKIQERARDIDRETDLVTHRADRFDSSELFLEISIVLCSISLLAETRLYWRLSFITTAIGIAIAIYGAVLR